MITYICVNEHIHPSIVHTNAYELLIMNKNSRKFFHFYNFYALSMFDEFFANNEFRFCIGMIYLLYGLGRRSYEPLHWTSCTAGLLGYLVINILYATGTGD